MKKIILKLRLLRGLMTSLFLLVITILNAQSNSDSAFPQYLYPEFSGAVLKMKNGTTQTTEMNYNMVTGNMVFKREGKPYDLTNPEIIDTVYLQNSKFVRFGKEFYEIVFVAPVSLFLENKGKLISAGKPAAYGTTSQTSSITSFSGISTASGYYNLELPPDLTVKVDRIYWVRRDGNMLSFINQKQFLKIFPEKENELKEYIKNNRIKIDKRGDMVKLIEYCNEIIPGK